jgi:hypothetical protein
VFVRSPVKDMFDPLLSILLYLNLSTLQGPNTSKDLTQCSEICGVYHGFMPIAVDSLSLFDFLTWLNSMFFSPFKRSNRH